MPKHLNSRAKELVGYLIRYFEEERDNGGPLLSINAVRERVTAALNLNISMVNSISQALKNNHILNSPPKRRPRPKSVTEIFNSDSIREEGTCEITWNFNAKRNIYGQ
ncbi:unnamed protein product [Psylliodes chrysocephalus]|uniref:Uncharacterized protein n=1 Tax=Psylliodes chrysocephalus TaxID=3402493 RepID=A0A9P0CVG1_9CUCU|nr:unnamed protein product [Psylliodes chrysocephala]